MESSEFKKEFLENVKSTATVTGEGSCAAFVDGMAEYLIESEVLSDFTPSYYTGKLGRSNMRVDGFVYDEFDNTMNLIIADYDGIDVDRRLTNVNAQRIFGQLQVFVEAVYESDLYRKIEISTPCADLVELMRAYKKKIRKFRFYIFTDGDMSAAIKTIDIEDYKGIPVEGQIWDLDRLYRVCCSEQGKQIIEVNFQDFDIVGIPCIEASSASTNKYKSYLGVIPGKVLADIYDKYGSKLLEGNVRSFLSTKVAVNKKIRGTILNEPEMFFAFNNGISVTASEVGLTRIDGVQYLTRAKDFQIINGGQTTASISNARYKDKANVDSVYVQMKLTSIAETTTDEADELIRNISRSSNSQNKVSDADFFASHPFHRRMEQISRFTFAPAYGGAQYETKWFYERARGQYLQEQMRLSESKKKQFQLQNPKEKVIKKTDLAKVQNCWRLYPYIVSRGAQTNFVAFADYIDEEWNRDDKQFNEHYFETTAALLIMFKYLETIISKQSWYQGGYRANVVYYTISLLKYLISKQYPKQELDLGILWNKQDVPDQLKGILSDLAELVFYRITEPNRGIQNVTQWCKRPDCWVRVRDIQYTLPEDIEDCLISKEEAKEKQQSSKKDQKMTNDINAQMEVVKYDAKFWEKLSLFCIENKMITVRDSESLKVACKIPQMIPTPAQSQRLLSILEKAKLEGFKA